MCGPGTPLQDIPFSHIYLRDHKGGGGDILGPALSSQFSGSSFQDGDRERKTESWGQAGGARVLSSSEAPGSAQKGLPASLSPLFPSSWEASGFPGLRPQHQEDSEQPLCPECAPSWHLLLKTLPFSVSVTSLVSCSLVILAACSPLLSQEPSIP